MPRTDDDKVQLVEMPTFDTLFNGVGISNLSNQTMLYVSNTIGRPQYTNMQQAAQIPSGGVLLVTGLRAGSFMQSLADSEYTVAYGTIAANTYPTSSPARMLDCYSMLGKGAQVTLNIAQKPYLIVPWDYLPAGGGANGFTTVAGRSVVTNGLPGKESVVKFSKPVKVSSLQAFNAQVNFYVYSKNSVAGGFTGYAQGSTSVATADVDPLLFLNQADGIKYAALFLTGAQSRDIS